MPEINTATMPRTRINGEFRPATVDKERRTIEVVFTTGQGGKRFNWRTEEEYIEELDVQPGSIRTARLDKGLSVIDSHNSWDGIRGVFGVTEGYRIEAGQLIGTVRFASDPQSDVHFGKVADGILRHVSLGYKVHKYLRTTSPEATMATYRAIDWEPTELSFVPVSFEDNNGVRADSNYPHQQVLIEEEKTMPEINTPETQRDKPRADPIIQDEPQHKPASQELRSELQHMLDTAQKAGLSIEHATRAYMDGITLDQYRAMVIDTLGDESNQHKITQHVSLKSDQRADQHENQRQAAEAYLLQRCGAIAEQPTDITQFRGLTTFEMARQLLERQGVVTQGMSRHKIAERAFSGTSDFPLILENVMNKQLLSGYQETPQTFRDLGRATTVNDFRDKHVYRIGDAPDLLPLSEHGEYKGAKISEAKEKYRISTYARKIGFTREMLINDEMDALSRVPRQFGAAASRLESNVVWGLLLNWDFFTGKAASHKMGDGKALFHIEHNNLLDGAGSALSKESLSALRKLGRQAKTLDGNYMNLEFQHLVLPPDLETVADELLSGIFTPATYQDVNPFTNRLKYRIEPRLEVISPAAWYAFSNMADTFEYATLAGEPDLYTEVVNSTDVDGLTIKVRKDFGAGLIDYRGMVKAAGSPK